MSFLLIICILFFYSEDKTSKKEAVNSNIELAPKVVKLKNLKEIVGEKKELILQVDRIEPEDEKIFYIEVNKSNSELKFELGKPFLVFDFENNFFTAVSKAIFVKEVELDGKKYLKFATYVRHRKTVLNDKLSYIGKPTNKDELNKYLHAMMDYSNISRELGDMHFGSMSFYASYGWSTLASKSSGPYDENNPPTPTSNGDIIYNKEINSKKNYDFYETYNFGYRWWFFFLPALGLDINYFFTAPIPTYAKEDESDKDEYFSSSFNGYAISLMYRRSFFRMPAIFGLKYFIDNFETNYVGDKLLSSSYSGLNVNFSWHFPYQFTIVPMGFAKMVFHDLELGAGISPIVFVSDKNYSRGARPSITSYRMNTTLLFNFESKYLDFLKNIFYGLMYEYVTYSLNFTGITEGDIPPNTICSEKYQYFGLKVKYEFNDPFGD